MKHRPRFIFKLLLFLLAGAIINVAVAWGVALFSDDLFRSLSVLGTQSTEVKQPMILMEPYPDPKLYVEGAFNSGTSMYRIQRSLVPGIRSGFSSNLHSALQAIYDKKIKLPAFVVSRVPKSDVSILIFRGWPMQSMWYSIECKADGWRPSLSLANPLIPDDQHYLRRFPVVAIWPGFAINTIFYAAILYALFAVPGAVRRRVRIKRGQCASCGYSLRESVSDKCPECGAATATSGTGINT